MTAFLLWDILATCRTNETRREALIIDTEEPFILFSRSAAQKNAADLRLVRVVFASYCVQTFLSRERFLTRAVGWSVCSQLFSIVPTKTGRCVVVVVARESLIFLRARRLIRRRHAERRAIIFRLRLA
jgi:hypothetical protein